MVGVDSALSRGVDGLGDGSVMVRYGVLGAHVVCLEADAAVVCASVVSGVTVVGVVIVDDVQDSVAGLVMDGPIAAAHADDVLIGTAEVEDDVVDEAGIVVEDGAVVAVMWLWNAAADDVIDELDELLEALSFVDKLVGDVLSEVAVKEDVVIDEAIEGADESVAEFAVATYSDFEN